MFAVHVHVQSRRPQTDDRREQPRTPRRDETGGDTGVVSNVPAMVCVGTQNMFE